MSGRSFRSVFMVASCAGAALGCYLVSLRVASERAALENVETQIVLAQRDIRLLQTEIGTRGRLAQLERWNVKVLALSAPSADQFLDGGFALAKMVAPQRKVDLEAPVVLASAPANAPKPRVEGAPQPQDPAGTKPACRREQMMHTASLNARDQARRSIAAAEKAAPKAGKLQPAKPTPRSQQAASRRQACDEPPPRPRPGRPAGAWPRPSRPGWRRSTRSRPSRPSPFREPPRTPARTNERADVRPRRPTARAAPPRRPAAPNPGGDAPAADVRHAGLRRGDRPHRPAHPVPRGVRRPCRAQGRDHRPDPRARRHRRPRRPAAGADHRRLDHRPPPDQGHRRQARDRPRAGAADAGARRRDLSCDAAVGQALLLSAPPRLARAGRGGQCAGRARPGDRPRARPALPADQPRRARHRLHRRRRPRRRRDRARVRRAIVRRRDPRRADHAVDLEPHPAGARA